MTYIPDLSAYNYHTFPRDSKLLAVGWLDSSEPYSQGTVRDETIRKLAKLARTPVNLCRGYHYCQFCPREASDRFLEHHAKGNGEVHIAGMNGVTYAAPALISHYIEKHAYKPPDEFLKAVEQLPLIDPRIAIVAALEREVHPLIKTWPRNAAEHEGRELIFFESKYAVVVVGGIGAEAARGAAQAVIVRYSPDVIVSAGIAGALVPELHVGETIFPARVIDAKDGSRHETAIKNAPLSNTALGRAVLVTSPQISGRRQKEHLAKSYGAQAVDMESAAVARAAMSHNIPFIAIKTISDECDFEMPEMSQFVRDGRFQEKRFVLYTALRPWLWLRVLRLARNARIASENLCAWLRESALTNTIIPGTISPHQS